jgi:DNA modification methylase
VIERGIELWSNPGDIVLTPFMGIGSEAYMAVKMGRKAVGVELKDSYYRQAVANIKNALNNVQMDMLLGVDTCSE